MGSAAGVLKMTAHRLGVTAEQYNARVAAGEKWCSNCDAWHQVSEFGKDSTRGDGLASSCRSSRSRARRNTYQAKPRPAPGRRFVPARNGDYRQARRRINHLIGVGLLPPPNDLPCFDCGHVYRRVSDAMNTTTTRVTPESITRMFSLCARPATTIAKRRGGQGDGRHAH